MSLKLIQILLGSMILMMTLTGTAQSIGSESDPNRIPDVLIELGRETETAYALIVEKSTQQIFLWADDGQLKEIYGINCSTGKAPGPKMLSGDSKTPEGIYFFTDKHEDEDLTPIYGTRAFPIDYPNLLDRLAGRDGNSIWLHGTDKPLEERNSNGCIVMANPGIDRLTPYITLNRTPLIIVEKLTYGSIDTSVKETITRQVLKWNAALETGTYHDYLKFYSPDYVPDISWWTDWLMVKKERLRISEHVFTFKLKRISIFKFKDIYVVLADQYVKLLNKELFIGAKKIYLTKLNNHFEFIGEEYQNYVNGKQKGVKTNPIIAACQKLNVYKGENEEIEEMLKGWIKAWSSKDLQKYGAYYSEAFRNKEKDLKEWIAYKGKLNAKYDFIRVSMDRLAIRKDAERRIITFRQLYESNVFKAVGKKTLILIRENDQWKIYREKWEKI
jgi:murein L,D-transpeptidase YafK